MNIDKISIGKDAPNQVNVIIEVPMNADPVKYEFDKEAGAIFVDRFLGTPMYYPCNYGFIPHTLSQDGDPVDVLVVGRRALMPGCVVGGIALGILQNMVGIFISPQAIAVTPFFVIMLVLLFKPQGFFDTTLAVKKV